MSFSNAGDIISSLLSLIVGPLCVAVPFLLTWGLVSCRYDLPYLKTINRCESSYNELRTHKLVPLLYNVIQLSRRLVIAIFIVGFKEMQSIQFQPLALTSVMCCYFSFHFKPFIYKQLNWFDLFNEVAITFLSYMVSAFTDYVDDEDIRYEFGFAWIILFLLLFYLDFIYILCRTIYFVVLKCKKKMPKKYLKENRYIK